MSSVRRSRLKNLRSSVRPRRNDSSVSQFLSPAESRSLDLLRRVQKNHSDFDPRRPEFPPKNPRFPASPTKVLRLPELPGVKVLVKDESVNPTGTHKDRMAWELARLYAKQLERKAQGKIRGSLPAISLISAGNAAIALGEMLHEFGLPAPHVLVDSRSPERLAEHLRSHHVLVFEADLGRRELSSDDVLRLTSNKRGLDLTRGRLAAELGRVYYDWMVFEILNQKPDLIVVPYGTGQLFDNLYQHYFEQLQRLKQLDPRLLDPKSLKSGVHLIGVTAPVGSLASKLSAPFLPESTKSEVHRTRNHVISQMVRSGVLGDKSGLVELKDSFLIEANRLALRHRISAEPSALAGIAWLLQHKKEIPAGSRVLIVNTGKGWAE